MKICKIQDKGDRVMPVLAECRKDLERIIKIYKNKEKIGI